MDGSSLQCLSCSPPFHITVVGLGAMGGGIARMLLHSEISKTVCGYDIATTLVTTFYEEAKSINKNNSTKAPTSISDAVVSHQTQIVILVLQNEKQCELICFGNNDDTNHNETSINKDRKQGDHMNLLTLLSKHSCVILCSTVSPTWVQKASRQFEGRGIYFIDCPISGGPMRARDGELTLLSSANEISHQAILQNPSTNVLFEVMARKDQWYVINGGAGNGSMVKMVHQLLAGVHIVVAAEALALAAKAGLDVEQFYHIVNGAAGSSWMFQDRGLRMMMEDQVEVKSYLEIFIKDLDIVYQEAKTLQSPIPMALVALQQFINASSLGYNRCDDSFVKKCYEQITGVPIKSNKVPDAVANNNNEVNTSDVAATITSDVLSAVDTSTDTKEFWFMEDGTKEEIVEVGNEPRHHIILHNKYIRAIRVQFPPNDTTLAHKHIQDSLYFFLVPDGLDVINHVKGLQPLCDCMEYGEVRYGAHKSEKPLIHKITNRSNTIMHCIDAEILCQPPITSPIPLVASYHECIKIRPNCRVYKLTLLPGQSVKTSYMFFHCTVVIQGGAIEKTIHDTNHRLITWKEECNIGDFDWKEPIVQIQKTNIGTNAYIEYIAEWT